MKNYAKRIAATAVMTAVCLGATMQLGLPALAYAVKNTDSTVMMTVDNVDVTKSEYAGYFSYCKSLMENQMGYGPYLWSMQPEAVQQLVAVADNNCLYARVVVDHFNALGLKLDRQTAWEYKQFRKDYAAAAAEQGMSFEDYIDQMGLDEDMFRNIYTLGLYVERLGEYYYGVGGEKAPAEDEVKAAFDKFFKAKHILISSTDDFGAPLTGDALAAKQALVAEIQNKLDAGEDFDTLMEQYSEDPGLATYPDGYIFEDDGSFVDEFVDGVKALEIGKRSEQAVESGFGWHFIKREALTDADYEKYRPQLVYALTGESIDDLVAAWMDEVEVSYPDGHEELGITDVLGAEAEAPSLGDLFEGGSSSAAE